MEQWIYYKEYIHLQALSSSHCAILEMLFTPIHIALLTATTFFQ